MRKYDSNLGEYGLRRIKWGLVKKQRRKGDNKTNSFSERGQSRGHKYGGDEAALPETGRDEGERCLNGKCVRLV